MVVIILAPLLVVFELLHGEIQPFGDDVVHLAVAHLDVRPTHGAVDSRHARQNVRLHIGGGIRRRIHGVLQFDLLADVFADGINAARHHDEKHENAERDDQSGTRIVPPNVTQTTICYV